MYSHHFILLVYFVFNFLPPSLHSFECDLQSGKKLIVHIIPHSHDDTGWIKTFDEYYNEDVSKIISSVVKNLPGREDRTYIQVESAFFKRWWKEQDEMTRDKVRGLVKEKKFEFTHGGWCMNDEASTYYSAIIDQMSLGLRFLNDTFPADARPTIAWQIDPFGHSAEQASLFSQMSFNALFMARIHYADLDRRRANQEMEFIWKGSKSYGRRSQLFTSLLYEHYTPPFDLCPTRACNEALPIEPLSRKYIREVCSMTKSYKTNHLLLPMGDDFAYKKAHVWYKAIDELIDLINEDGRIKAQYSTPSRYIKSVLDDHQEWSVKTDDFFPYADLKNRYWTGYYTSRPTFKRFLRESNNILQACKQMEVLLIPTNQTKASSQALREAVGMNQHHDAITGTMKEYVLADYKQMLQKGRRKCQGLMTSYIEEKLTSSSPTPIKFQLCENLNISQCDITEKEDAVIINLYNPIGRKMSHYIRVPLKSDKASVFGPNAEPIKSQILPIDKNAMGEPISKHEIVFKVELPALGYATYFLQNNVQNDDTDANAWSDSPNKNVTVIESNKIKIEFFAENGRMKSIMDKKTGQKTELSQRYYVYRQTRSGAYVFNADGLNPPEEISLTKTTAKYGSVVQEVRQEFANHVTQTIRLFHDSDYVEIEYTVQLLMEMELVTRFYTNIHSNRTFYTDANGREMQKRIRLDDVAAHRNYYPITSRIFINDASRQFVVASDRAQGGSSLSSGQIELMIHRRLTFDDNLGVEEGLKDPTSNPTRGKYRLFCSSVDKSSSLHRLQAGMMSEVPLMRFASNPYSIKESIDKFETTYSALTRALPKNVHLLTMETSSKAKNTIILRFEHLFAKDEDSELSKPVEISLEDLFSAFDITDVQETNLSANQYIKDKQMLPWTTTDGSDNTVVMTTDIVNENENLSFVLSPMQIRTFFTTIEFK